MHVNHVAVLTHTLEAVTSRLPDFCTPLEIEEQPAEGTREQYVNIAGEGAPMLLLMQPVAQGPYMRAMKKRGPGLHHIGGTTGSISALLPRIAEHRLLVHPISLHTIARKEVWLCRPGVPFLVEITEDDSSDSVMCRLELPAKWPVPPFVRGFFSNLEVHNAADDRICFRVGDRTVSFSM